MKANSKDMFEVICGRFSNSAIIDREVFESYEDACFEAATQSLEEYFLILEPADALSEDESLGIFCVIRIKGNKHENDFVILTHFALRNAGLHDLANNFERASDSYLSAVNKKEK